MGPVVTICDVTDSRLDDYRNLSDAELRRRRQPAEGIFLAEGSLVIRQLLASSYPVRSFLLTRARLDDLSADLRQVGSRAPVYLVDNEAMAGICGFPFHRGALASAQRVASPASGDLLSRPASVMAVAEGINDHENLGALFRNAAAFGLDAVLLSPTCADPLYRRSVRVSMGQVLRVPWARLDPWPAALHGVKAAGFVLIALTPDVAARPLDQVLSGWPSRPVAVLVGAEGPGLSADACRAADSQARIPMAPGVDSLNVATAAAIAFHQAVGRGPTIGARRGE